MNMSKDSIDDNSFMITTNINCTDGVATNVTADTLVNQELVNQKGEIATAIGEYLKQTSDQKTSMTIDKDQIFKDLAKAIIFDSKAETSPKFIIPAYFDQFADESMVGKIIEFNEAPYYDAYLI